MRTTTVRSRSEFTERHQKQPTEQLRDAMIPRMRLDIGWRDIVYGLCACLFTPARAVVEAALYKTWCDHSPPVSDVARVGAKSSSLQAAHSSTEACPPLATLSIRSGFDSLLTALSLPPGSEVLISAATIADMPRILREHALVPVPVDLDMRQLSVRTELLEQSLTERTRAILVAHIFGSRMPMEPIVEFARRRGLLIIEDCAQAFAGSEWHGSPNSDVRMFSFGPIKTATALGGAIFCFRDGNLREATRTVQNQWPIQSRWSYLARLFKYSELMLLSTHMVYTAFSALCRWRGTNHDRVINGTVRGFDANNFFPQIRRRPCTPLLQLLERRLRKFDPKSVERRVATAVQAISSLNESSRIGDLAVDHTHWVVPMWHEQPEELVNWLWKHGLDATRGASTMDAVEPPADRPELAAVDVQRVFRNIVYLPVGRGVSRNTIERLLLAIEQFDNLERSKCQSTAVSN